MFGLFQSETRKLVNRPLHPGEFQSPDFFVVPSFLAICFQVPAAKRECTEVAEHDLKLCLRWMILASVLRSQGFLVYVVQRRILVHGSCGIQDPKDLITNSLVPLVCAKRQKYRYHIYIGTRPFISLLLLQECCCKLPKQFQFQEKHDALKTLIRQLSVCRAKRESKRKANNIPGGLWLSTMTRYARPPLLELIEDELIEQLYTTVASRQFRIFSC